MILPKYRFTVTTNNGTINTHDNWGTEAGVEYWKSEVLKSDDVLSAEYEVIEEARELVNSVGVTYLGGKRI